MWLWVGLVLLWRGFDASCELEDTPAAVRHNHMGWGLWGRGRGWGTGTSNGSWHCMMTAFGLIINPTITKCNNMRSATVTHSLLKATA